MQNQRLEVLVFQPFSSQNQELNSRCLNPLKTWIGSQAAGGFLAFNSVQDQLDAR